MSRPMPLSLMHSPTGQERAGAGLWPPTLVYSSYLEGKKSLSRKERETSVRQSKNDLMKALFCSKTPSMADQVSDGLLDRPPEWPDLQTQPISLCSPPHSLLAFLKILCMLLTLRLLHHVPMSPLFHC